MDVDDIINALENDNNEQMFVGTNSDSETPENISDRIDNEVCKIINHCESVAKKINTDGAESQIIISIQNISISDKSKSEMSSVGELKSKYNLNVAQGKRFAQDQKYQKATNFFILIYPW